MIKVGIIGGSDPMAGELLRLLINHPDVRLMWVNSNRFAGRLIADMHHGLIGETDMRFSPTADLDQISLLFIFRHRGQTIEWLADRVLPDDLYIIDLSVDMQKPALAEEYGYVYGLPELNRKPLVRGANRAILPHPIATLGILSLLPLAKHEWIDGDIDINATTPTSGERPEVSEDEIIAEISTSLREVQHSLNDPIALKVNPPTHVRAMGTTITMPTTVDVGELTRAYEEFYNDHNFVHIVTNRLPEPKDVEGTNKCLIYIDKKDGKVVISSMMDALLKGGAGTAVHDMNLMFGLHELTGLALKASNF